MCCQAGRWSGRREGKKKARPTHLVADVVHHMLACRGPALGSKALSLTMHSGGVGTGFHVFERDCRTPADPHKFRHPGTTDFQRPNLNWGQCRVGHEHQGGRMHHHGFIQMNLRPAQQRAKSVCDGEPQQRLGESPVDPARLLFQRQRLRLREPLPPILPQCAGHTVTRAPMRRHDG
jgi:hypothetical protein